MVGDTIVRPFRDMADADWDVDACRAIMWESINPAKCVGMVCFMWWGWRKIMRMAVRFDWSDKGLFKQRRTPVKELWGPPPPRRYDDDGNLLNP